MDDNIQHGNLGTKYTFSKNRLNILNKKISHNESIKKHVRVAKLVSLFKSIVALFTA